MDVRHSFFCFKEKVRFLSPFKCFAALKIYSLIIGIAALASREAEENNPLGALKFFVSYFHLMQMVDERKRK